MEQQDLEEIVQQVINKLMKPSQDVLTTTKKLETLTVIQSEHHSFDQLNLETQQALLSLYDIQVVDIKEIMTKKSQKNLLLDLPLSIQSKAAMGIADCPLTCFLQSCFVEGREVSVLSDHLIGISEIQSQEYQKLFVKYQRILKDFGLTFINEDMLKQNRNNNSWLITSHVEPLARGSTLKIKKNCVVSYGAKELIKNKNIAIIRE